MTSVSCDDCAAVCCRLEVICPSETGIPPYLTTRNPWGMRVMRRLDDAWCAALDRDSLRCRIYEQRPEVCRNFAMGGPDCLAERSKPWPNR